MDKNTKEEHIDLLTPSLIEHLLCDEYIRSTKNVIVNKTKTPLSIMEFKFWGKRYKINKQTSYSTKNIVK